MTEIDIPKQSLAMAHLVLAHALKLQLSHVAQQHDGKQGVWLDEIEAAVVYDVKQIKTSGISEEDEFKVMRGAIAIVEAMFADFRASLLPSS